MSRRIHPRHLTERPLVAPYTDAGDWSGSWGAQVPVRAQVRYERVLTVTADGTSAASVLTLAVDPSKTVDIEQLFTLDSAVTYRGSTSWVLATRPVLRHGVLVYLEVTTGDRPPDFGGWKATATLHRGPGKDRFGNPIPAVDVDLGTVVVVPGSSSEPVDRDQSTQTTARLITRAGGPVIASTDRVTVLTSPMAGTYQVDGDPAPRHDGTVTPLRKI